MRSNWACYSRKSLRRAWKAASSLCMQFYRFSRTSEGASCLVGVSRGLKEAVFFISGAFCTVNTKGACTEALFFMSVSQPLREATLLKSARGKSSALVSSPRFPIVITEMRRLKAWVASLVSCFGMLSAASCLARISLLSSSDASAADAAF